MSDPSRGRVTITLGRSGHVVKRDASAVDVSSFSSIHSAGTKRSVRDRIGSNADSSGWHGNGHSGNKRHRGDVSMQNGLDGNDLRLKLMRKSALGQADSNGSKRHMDLREKLSKASHPLANTYNSKQHGPDSRETSLRQIPSARSSDKLLRMESMRSSYSPWTLDHIRRRSPDGFPSTSRGISPQRDVQDLHRRPVSRTYDGVRSVSYVGRDVLETSRPPISTPQSFMSRSTMSTLPPVTVKPVASHPGQLPPSGSVAQRPSYVILEFNRYFELCNLLIVTVLKPCFCQGQPFSLQLVFPPSFVGLGVHFSGQFPCYCLSVFLFPVHRICGIMRLSQTVLLYQELLRKTDAEQRLSSNSAGCQGCPAMVQVVEPIRQQRRGVAANGNDGHEISHDKWCYSCNSTGSVMASRTAGRGAVISDELSGLEKLMGDEQVQVQQSHQTVDGLLHALGLQKYAILFKAEEVDMTALKQMGENDLKELGIPMGPRKKILLAVLPRTKRQQ
ncbi:hypothetical protein D0Y65_000358 [Glycine soja]|uniref:SAM domain-containing protein n=1 Tax=Glycine soja TaxID=3848 RepID=A0A445LYD0_GLYSO|nr:hypothetical protein D0Y65_000358 [Glycine soja]